METRGELGEWSLQLQGHASIFHVEGRRRPSTSQQDEAALVQAARKELQRHKTQRRLSRIEKGALADRVLQAGASELPFAQRLGALLRLDPRPLPTVTVEFRDLQITAEALVGSAGNPSVLNSAKDVLRLVTLQRPPTTPHTILAGVSGVLLPGRMTLLLGPPGGGKTVLLQALSGRLRPSATLKIEGSIKYNGMGLDEFQPRRTAGLVQQQDQHLADLTVQETVDFAFRCQVGPAQREMMFSRIEVAARTLEERRQKLCAGGARLAAAEAGGEELAPDEGVTAAGGASGEANAANPSAGPPPANGHKAGANGAAPAAGQAAGGGTECDDLEADEEFARTMQEVVGKRLLPYVAIRIMGLAHAAQTQVGDSETRGISGGERKRLTTAEIIVGQQSVVFMDEISTGLDSATAYSVIHSFRDVSHHLRRTFLISLLQPAPEVIQLFDDILLLTDGRVIYHGPVDGVLSHFEGLGFVCPTRKDPGSFLQEVTTPAGQWIYASKAKLAQHGLTEADRAPAALLEALPTELLTTVEELHRVFWEGTEQGRGVLRRLEAEPFRRSAASDQAVQTAPYGNSVKVLLREVVRRQFLLNWRMRTFYIARVVQTVILALIISSLFATIDPTPQEGRNAVAILVLSAIFLSMNSAPQLAFSQLAKPVMIKQRDNHLFPPWTFAVTQVITQLPQSTVEAIAFSLVTYWISGLTRTASCFFVYLLITWSASNCLAGLFRSIGYAGKTMVLANSSAMLILLLMIVSNGFSIVYPSIPPYIVWIYWINPMAWAIKALVINELTADRWQDYTIPCSPQPCTPQTAGDTIMQPFGFPPNRAYIWGAVGYLWGLLVILTALAALALKFARAPSPQPTVPEAEIRKEVQRSLFSRLQRQLHQQLVAPIRARSMRRPATPGMVDEEAPADRSSAAGSSATGGTEQVPPRDRSPSPLPFKRGAAEPNGVPLSFKRPERAAPRVDAGVPDTPRKAHERVAVPFTPITLVCRDLRYYVPDPSKGEAEGVVKGEADREIAGKLELLKGISFYARPGELTALMGGSGAGKTTLMDCVLGRKTVGLLRGDILVNGYPKQQDTWSRVCGYVEQQDIHSGRATVRESLLFSARLRLPEDIPLDKVKQLVDETLDLTELARLQHSIVGEGDGGQGLSVEQRKRLSIAVELVAAPAVMFLDEPTSGLDARAAAIVMRAIQNVAKTNRTIMVTIHQPSTEIFESMDMLLLMQLGGRTTYFGKLGLESSALIAYLEAQPGVEPIHPGSNPATWMLEVTGGSMSTVYTSSHADFPGLYQESQLQRGNEATMDRLVQQGLEAHTPLTVASQYAASFGLQRRMLLKKFFAVYFRSPHYNFVRLLMATIIAVIYGITFREQGNIEGTLEDPASLGDVQNVMGLLFSSAIFIGMFNAITVQPLIAAERIVFYRERAASMYAPGPYSLALGLAEVPYLIAQSLVMVNITYWLVHFSRVGWKYGYFLLLFSISLLMYTLCGQFLVFATPNQLLAQLLAASLNQLWTISNGFLIPYPAIPRGWKWLNRISPTTWILYGLGESQLGDSQTPMLVFGNVWTTVGEFMSFYFDYDWGFIWWCVLIVFAYAVFFRLGSSALLRFVSFQKR